MNKPKEVNKTNSFIKKSRPEVMSSRSYLISEVKLVSSSDHKKGVIADSPPKSISNGHCGVFGSNLRRALKMQLEVENKMARPNPLKKPSCVPKRQLDDTIVPHSDCIVKKARHGGERIHSQLLRENRYVYGLAQNPEMKQVTIPLAHTGKPMNRERDAPVLVTMPPKRTVFANKEWIQRNSHAHATAKCVDATLTNMKQNIHIDDYAAPVPMDKHIELRDTIDAPSFIDTGVLSTISRASATQSDSTIVANDFTEQGQSKFKDSANYVRRNMKSRGTSRRKARRRVYVERERDARRIASSGDESSTANTTSNTSRSASESSGWSALGLDPLQMSLDMLDCHGRKTVSIIHSSCESNLEKNRGITTALPMHRATPAPTSQQREKKITQIRGISQAAVNVSITQPPLCSGHQMSASLVTVKKSGTNKVRHSLTS